MSWSSEQTALLIELYENHPCLYVVKHPDYHNKLKRSAALTNILGAMEALRPNITEHEIQKKFLGLRTTYTQERRKVLDSLHSGMGEDEVYHPTLWYYEKISYLQDHIQSRHSRSSFTLSDKASQEQNTSVVEETIPTLQQAQTWVYNVAVDGICSPTPDTARNDDGGHSDGTTHNLFQAVPGPSDALKKPAPTANKTAKKIKKHSDSQETELLKSVSDNLCKLSESLQKETPQNTSDDIMGQFVAAQLKKNQKRGYKTRYLFRNS